MDFTPAYAMNPDFQGHEERGCECGATFTCYKTSRQRKCTTCYSRDKEEHCGRCAGTGQFITGITNNVPTGPGGVCFRCGGKGYQTEKDRRRNDYYDQHRSISL